RTALFIAFTTNQIFFELGHIVLWSGRFFVTSHSLQTNCRFSLIEVSCERDVRSISLLSSRSFFTTDSKKEAGGF
ncbi:MAG: hypothetical protein L0Z50_23615, partial [Verrucomicrobiales bacterium]|nr:hypothetical protein [Verrucomicrobiales bacterium]